MSDRPDPDYRALLQRAGVARISDEDIADLAPGLAAIDGKIDFIRRVALGQDAFMPDPLDPLTGKGAKNG